MFSTLSAQLGAGITLLVCLAALIFGEKRERLGAVIFMMGWVSSLVVSSFLIPFQHSLFIAIDLSCLIGFITLCWKSPHPWPYFACGAQSICLMSESAFAMHINIWTWKTVTILSGYAVILAIAIGTFAAVKRRKASVR